MLHILYGCRWHKILSFLLLIPSLIVKWRHFLISDRRLLHRRGWRTVAISYPEAVWRAVVARRRWWIWLTRNIWPWRTLYQDSGIVGCLVFIPLLLISLLNLLSVRLLFPVCSFRLKNLDLAAGWVQMFCVFSTLILLKCINLNSERNAFLPAMLPRGEFCANTMYLNVSRHSFGRIPQELYSV